MIIYGVINMTPKEIIGLILDAAEYATVYIRVDYNHRVDESTTQEVIHAEKFKNYLYEKLKEL